MERTVEKTELKPQVRFRDGMYPTRVENVKEIQSKMPEEDGYILVEVVVEVSATKQEKCAIALPMKATFGNKHGRFYTALFGRELAIGDKYDTDLYVGELFEALWEWDSKKLRMKADKFLFHDVK